MDVFRTMKIKYIIPVLMCLLLVTTSYIPRAEQSSHDGKRYMPNLIPALRWEPKSYDFGYVHAGSVYQTTFDIWNNGTGNMIWTLQVRSPYVSVYPTSGSSTGERDTVTVTIDTTGLDSGVYEGNVYIHSEGDYIFYTYFTVTDSILSFSPSQIDLVCNDTVSQAYSSLELWNDGEGDLSWNVITSQPWISVFPTSGVITDQIQKVDVTIDVSKLDMSVNSGEIIVHSTAGEVVVPVNIRRNTPPSKPFIDGSEKTKVNKDMCFTFSSVDAENDSLYYYIDWGDGTHIEWIGPYVSGEIVALNHSWISRGRYTIACKAKDVYQEESLVSMFTVSTALWSPFSIFYDGVLSGIVSDHLIYPFQNI